MPLDANGTATFNGVTLNAAGSGITLSLSATGLAECHDDPDHRRARAPDHFVITTPPPGSVAAGSPFSVSVSAGDLANSNLISSYTGTVSLAITPGTGPVGETLGGTLTATFVEWRGDVQRGDAEHDGHRHQAHGPGGHGCPDRHPGCRDDRASRHRHGQRRDSTAHVAPPPALQPPTSLSAGSPVQPGLQRAGHPGPRTSSFSGNVTLTLTQAPSGATINGQTTVAVVAGTGLATFSNLTLTQSGYYTIQASSNGLTPVSISLIVNALPATQLVVDVATALERHGG